MPSCVTIGDDRVLAGHLVDDVAIRSSKRVIGLSHTAAATKLANRPLLLAEQLVRAGDEDELALQCQPDGPTGLQNHRFILAVVYAFHCFCSVFVMVTVHCVRVGKLICVVVVTLWDMLRIPTQITNSCCATWLVLASEDAFFFLFFFLFSSSPPLLRPACLGTPSCDHLRSVRFGIAPSWSALFTITVLMSNHISRALRHCYNAPFAS